MQPLHSSMSKATTVVILVACWPYNSEVLVCKDKGPVWNSCFENINDKVHEIKQEYKYWIFSCLITLFSVILTFCLVLTQHFPADIFMAFIVIDFLLIKPFYCQCILLLYKYVGYVHHIEKANKNSTFFFPALGGPPEIGPEIKIKARFCSIAQLGLRRGALPCLRASCECGWPNCEKLHFKYPSKWEMGESFNVTVVLCDKRVL